MGCFLPFRLLYDSPFVQPHFSGTTYLFVLSSDTRWPLTLSKHSQHRTTTEKFLGRYYSVGETFLNIAIWPNHHHFVARSVVQLPRRISKLLAAFCTGDAKLLKVGRFIQSHWYFIRSADFPRGRCIKTEKYEMALENCTLLFTPFLAVINLVFFKRNKRKRS